MKLSVSWIFDHINADYTQFDIKQLVQKFNLTTAEIEHVEKVFFDVHSFTLVQVTKITSEFVLTHSRELNQEIKLPFRQDCVEGNFYILIQDSTWRWARLKDWKSSKEGLLPAFSCTGPECAGSWKNIIREYDYILHVDNKSITNRPDLWSHRGFAREIAAIYGLSLHEKETIFATHQIVAHERKAGHTTGNPFNVELNNPDYCKRFSALYIANIGYYSSWLWMAQRLCNIDIRPIDALVDTTNYVMLDIGQPLHVYDAEKINSNCVVARMAKNSETLQLLDSQTVELTDADIVITDGKRPLALGGIMGGKESALTSVTRSILVEAANFDASTVRKTAQRIKLRTDASTRFEKTLDPNLNDLGLLRFLKILEEQSIPLITASDIISLGKLAKPLVIEITHEKLEQSLGVNISSDFIEKTFHALEFQVKTEKNDEHCKYIITVPTFRSTKDVQIPEDIIEEIGRFYGFGNIPLQLPKMELKPHSLHDVLRVRQIRQCLVTALQAHEIYNYACYDESFLNQLEWKPENAVFIKNPVSHNWVQLVTSLIPHLIRSVVHAGTHQEEIRFFEINRIWHRHEDAVQEQSSLAGIMYNKTKEVNFYCAKDQLEQLFNILGISVTWVKYNGLQPWYNQYETATLIYKNEIIGHAGIANSAFLQRVLHGNAFIFELNATILVNLKREQTKFKPLGKYQDSWFDISMFIPLEITVEQIKNIIKNADDRIVSVDLQDFFEKKEWVNKRSATLRIIIADPEKTFIKEEIDTIHTKVLYVIEKLGATIR